MIRATQIALPKGGGRISASRHKGDINGCTQSDGLVRPRQNHKLVSVQDNGPGVPVHERARMLERFYRVAGTAGEGSGLGLAIAEEIARVHNSHLQVLEGQGGQGLRMRLVLPD